MSEAFHSSQVFFSDRAGSLLTALPPIDLHWAIEANWAQNALSMLERIGWRAHASEFQAAAQDGQPDAAEKPFQFQDGIAILGLTGPMTKRPQSFGGGTSTVRLRQQVRAAASDPEVKSILLLIDSPGGQVSGTHELANDVSRAQEKKPVVAYIEDLGASAAYWVASQAGKVYANEPAFVGSIGTYLVVGDWSQAAENAGVKVHVVKAGEYKGAGYPGVPVEDKHLAHYQELVNRVNETFVKSVQNGRKWTPEQAQALADGRVHVARDAKKLGLVDNVRTLDGVLGEMRADAKRSGPTAGATAASSGREEEQAMSRVESFLAWLKGEGGEEPKAEEKPAVVGVFSSGVGMTTDLQAEQQAKEAAQAQVGAILADIKPEIIRAGIRAGMPAKLVESTVNSMAASGDWQGLKEFWADAKAEAEKTIKPGTSADREKATEEPTGENDERRASLTARAKARREQQLAMHGNGRRADDA